MRQVAKWTGAVVSVIVVPAWVFSFSGMYEITWISRSADYRVSMHNGFIEFEWMRPGWASFDPNRIGWSIRPWLFSPSWWPPFRLGWAPLNSPDLASGLVRQWFLSLCVVTPTAFLFYRDRRRPRPGHSQKCGYDLTGNVSGKCPECGGAV